MWTVRPSVDLRFVDFRNSRKNYMGAKNSLWWDGGPVRFVEEVGIPCKYTDKVPCFGSNQIELC